MTNQEHWQKAKEQIEKKLGYPSWYPIDTSSLEYFNQAAELMAQSIRDEQSSKLKYLQFVIDLHNVSESVHVQMIDSLKRIIELQYSLRSIISKYSEYSESVDEIPNQWFIEACEIAEKALEKSKDIDYEFETRKVVKEVAAQLTEKDKEIERLRGGIKKYVWQMDQFFSSPKVGQPPALKDLNDLL